MGVLPCKFSSFTPSYVSIISFNTRLVYLHLKAEVLEYLYTCIHSHLMPLLLTFHLGIHNNEALAP